MVRTADPVSADHFSKLALSHFRRGELILASEAALRALSFDPFCFAGHEMLFFCIANADPPGVEHLVGLWSKVFLPEFSMEVREEALIEAFADHPNRYDLFLGVAIMMLEMGRPVRAEEIAFHCLTPLDGADWGEHVVEDKYDELASTYDDRSFHAETAKNFLAAVTMRLAGKANLSIVEAACGTGGLAQGLRPYASRLTGIDLSRAMAERARPLYDAMIVGDMVAALAGMDHVADAVFCCGATYYLRDFLPFLQAAGAALKPGGLLMFSDFVAPPGSGTMVTVGGTKRYFRSTDLIRALADEAGLVEIGFDYGVSYRMPCRHWCFETKAPG